MKNYASLFKRRKNGSAPPAPSSRDDKANGLQSKNLLSASLPVSHKASGKQRDGRLPPLPDDGGPEHTPRQYYHATMPGPAMFIKENSSNGIVNEHGQLGQQAPAFFEKVPSASLPHPMSNARQASRRMSTGSIPSLDYTMVNVPSEELQALDISCDNICSLIRTYLANRELWRQDLRFANPHDLSGLIKWALGRYTNAQGARGFLTWEMYERWRFGEREKEFPPRYITTHLLYLLPTQTAALLTSLLNLLSSAVTYTSKNGCSTRKLATLFGAYIFGLPDDSTFEQTYTAFNRFSHATEHLLLAFMRDQSTQHTNSTSQIPIPVRIQEVIKNYPQCLPTNLNKPPASATLQPVARIRRHVRFYSKNLVASAGTWQVSRSQSWAVIAPFPSFDPETSAPIGAAPFVFSTRYKHLLNIRGQVSVDDEEELQRFGSVVEKEWSSFMQSGFAAPDETKLKFDLTESDRARRLQRRDSMDWATFEGAGFTNLLAMDLAFDPLIDDPSRKGGILSPKHRDELLEKARQIEKALPPFNYDISARDERGIQIDTQFFEIFSDVLCSSGWTRDEMKESNWALIQFKTRPLSSNRPTSSSGDGRTEDSWYLVEELIPSEYRAMLLQASQQKPKSSRRISFLRSVRRKNSKLPPVPGLSQSQGVGSNSAASRSNLSVGGSSGVVFGDNRSASPSLRVPDTSVFSPGKGGSTKQISLSKSYSEKTISHDSIAEEEETLDEPVSSGTAVINGHKQAEPSTLPNGVNGTLSNQRRNSFSLGFTKSPSSSSLNGSGSGGAANAIMSLARRATRRHRRSNPSVDSTVRPPSPPRSLLSNLGADSPGLDVEQHGVSGPGQPINDSLSPSPAPYYRDRNGTPSVAETMRSAETRATNGHGDSGSLATTPTGGLPSMMNFPRRRDSMTTKFQRGNRSVRDERELPLAPGLADTSADTSFSRNSVMSENPYDGMEDEGSTQAGHGEGSTSSPSRDRKAEEHKSVEHDSLPEPPILEMFPVEERPSRSAPQAIAPATPPKSAFHKRSNSIQARLAAEIDARKDALSRPNAPVQGSGRVAALAGRFQ